MLEWIWTFISLTAVIIFIFAEKDGIDSSPDKTILGLSAMVFALVFSWPMTGALFQNWLNATIPQQGTEIHKLTVYAILGLVYLSVFVAFPMSVTYIKYTLKRKDCVDGE